MKWQRGQKAELARRVGISRQYLNLILHGRRHAAPELAIKIEKETKSMEGIYLSRLDVLYPAESHNELLEVF